MNGSAFTPQILEAAEGAKEALLRYSHEEDQTQPLKEITYSDRQVFYAICLHLDIDIIDVLSERRPARLIAQRATIAHVLRAQGWTLQRIGDVMGGRDHGTIRNLLNKELA